MKKILFIIVLLFFAVQTSAQDMFDDSPRKGRFQHDKLEELRQLKLMEELNLDEETSVRFFKRQSDFRKTLQGIMEKRDAYMKELSESLIDGDKEDSFYSGIIDKIMKVEQDLLQSKRTFFNSCSDILSKEQIAKVLVFDFKFFKQLRGLMMERGGKGSRLDKGLN